MSDIHISDVSSLRDAYNRRVANMLCNIIIPAAKRAKMIHRLEEIPITRTQIAHAALSVELGITTEGYVRKRWREQWEAIH